jgi:hypothetical protein
MDFDTITDVSIWAIFALGLSLPAWLVFYPPRIIRSWPSFLRLLIAILCTHAAIYALFYCCIYPVVRAYAGAHPGYLLDGIPAGSSEYRLEDWSSRRASIFRDSLLPSRLPSPIQP